MVFVIEPIVTPKALTSHRDFHSSLFSKIAFTWHLDQINGKIMSTYDLPVVLTPPSANELIISMQGNGTTFENELITYRCSGIPCSLV
jgi:hypothetical protein